MLRIDNAPLIWRDQVPIHQLYGDHYFSRDGGLEESIHVFLGNNNLPQAWQNSSQFVIGETGFGTGLNFLATVNCWLSNSHPHQTLHYLSIDQFAMRADDMKRVFKTWPALSAVADELINAYPAPIAGVHRRVMYQGRVCLTLVFGTVEGLLPQLQGKVDAWYLDGFAPSKNPDMWQADVFQHIARLSHDKTSFATFTVAGAIRRGLQAAGFSVEKTPGFGRKREMLKGWFTASPPVENSAPWFRQPETRSKSDTALVVGGGIAGISTAYYLCQRGFRVQLLEQQNQLATGGSGNPAGVVYPQLTQDWSLSGRFHLAAFLQTCSELDRLKLQQPDLPWYRTGVVLCMETKRVKQLLNAGVPESILRAVTQAEAKELLGSDITSGGIYFPGGGWLDAAGFCARLVELAGSQLQVFTSTQVKQLERQAQSWVAASEDGRSFQSDIVVFANAHAASQFPQTAELPLIPSRGQISILESGSFNTALPMPVCGPAYIVPIQKGGYVVGASYDRENLDLALRQRDHSQNMDQLQQLFPQVTAVADSLLSGRAAIRASSPDHLPLLGPLPDWSYYREHYQNLKHGQAAQHYAAARYQTGAYVSLAYGSRGLSTALPCAALLADLICATPACFPGDVLQALHPGRFLVRGLKRGVC